MSRDIEMHQKDPKPAVPARRPYRAPRLAALGDVRSLTLGGSPGTGDSVNFQTTQSPS